MPPKVRKVPGRWWPKVINQPRPSHAIKPERLPATISRSEGDAFLLTTEKFSVPKGYACARPHFTSERCRGVLQKGRGARRQDTGSKTDQGTAVGERKEGVPSPLEESETEVLS